MKHVAINKCKVFFIYLVSRNSYTRIDFIRTKKAQTPFVVYSQLEAFALPENQINNNETYADMTFCSPGNGKQSMIVIPIGAHLFVLYPVPFESCEVSSCRTQYVNKRFFNMS